MARQLSLSAAALVLALGPRCALATDALSSQAALTSQSAPQAIASQAAAPPQPIPQAVTDANATLEPRALLGNAAPGQCCVAVADACCPAGTSCYPPYGCITQGAPVNQVTSSEDRTSHMGPAPLGLIVVTVLVTACACLLLTVCCAKQLCACLFDPGPDGEWSGAQMGMAGLAGAAAGYELENMMDGYGGRYRGGFGGPGW